MCFNFLKIFLPSFRKQKVLLKKFSHPKVGARSFLNQYLMGYGYFTGLPITGFHSLVIIHVLVRIVLKFSVVLAFILVQ